jgi:uncharacterized protein YbaR (Trm112 family)
MNLERLLGYVVCPHCQGRLEPDPAREWLICATDRLAYPIRDGIACLTAESARPLDPATRD